MLSLGWVGALVGAVCVSAAQVPLEVRTNGNYSQIVVFGDSLVDNGNGTYQLTDHEWPRKCCSWHGRFSNGPTWPEELATLLHVSHVDDIAYGGSTTNDKHVQGKSGYNESIPVPGLVKQVDKYLHKANGKADADAIYILSSGSNDLYYGLQESLDIFKIADQAVDTLKAQAERLIKLGAKTLSLSSVMDFGRTPSSRIEGGLIQHSGANVYMLRFNRRVQDAVKELTQKYHVTVAFIDLYSYFNEIVKDKKHYGLKNVKDACMQGVTKGEQKNGKKKPTQCSNPDEYFFWDVFHPTHHVHQILAQKALNEFI